MSIKGKIVAALDIGTTKLACVIAEISDKNIRIIGYGYRQSVGISSSAITDMKLAQLAITKTISAAEKMAGFNINKLVVNVSGLRLDSVTKLVSNKITSKVVNNSDIMALVSGIKADFKNDKRDIIHLIPLEYKIDHTTKILNPKYMSGENLSGKFYVISVKNSIIKNIENCMKSSTVSVNNYICDSYAASLGVISENELNFGTLVIDIGGNSTSFAILIDNKLHHIGNCKLGGIHITRDIAAILNVNLDIAENIKLLNNSLIVSPVEEKELIKFKLDNDVYPTKLIELTKIDLRNIIAARLEEIITMVKNNLEKSGYSSYMINNIIVSGGVANMIGIEKLIENIFKKSVSIGYPIGIKNLPKDLNNPSFSVVVGMVIFLKQVMKKQIKTDFEVKNNFIKKIIDY
ncbi:cell division protein FtsA, partial [Rickettsiales bacterium]|nr:cell division protein FtsA [Rickettsiales bacterium]